MTLHRQQALEENFRIPAGETKGVPFGYQCGGEGGSCRNQDILDYNAGVFYLPMAGLYAISATLCFDTGATGAESSSEDSNVAISVTPVGGTGFHKRTIYAKVPKTASSSEAGANFSVSIYTEIEVYCACQMLRIDVTALDGTQALSLRGCKNAPGRDLVTFASVRLLCHCPQSPCVC